MAHINYCWPALFLDLRLEPIDYLGRLLVEHIHGLRVGGWCVASELAGVEHLLHIVDGLGAHAVLLEHLGDGVLRQVAQRDTKLVAHITQDGLVDGLVESILVLGIERLLGCLEATFSHLAGAAGSGGPSPLNVRATVDTIFLSSGSEVNDGTILQ